MKTKDRLAEELEKYGCPPEMVQRAREGFFDDYESPLATPVIALVKELQGLKKFALATRAMSGEFDGTREEGEAWMEREGMDLLVPPGSKQ